MRFHEADLLPGEVMGVIRNANAVVDVREAGLDRFRLDGLMGAVGMRGQEAVGGRLRLTNYRLVFTSHRLNRVRGTFSVFLPAVTGVRDASSGVTRKVEVTTGTQNLTFVLWGVPRFMTAVGEARRSFAPAWSPELARAVLADPGKVGGGDMIARRLGAAGIVLSRLTPGDAMTAVGEAIGPDFDAFEITGALQLVDLLACAGPPDTPWR